MITARDVAEKLGVSISTVGRALANDPRISADTATRVKRAADELGYVGNLPAQMMRGGSSNLIGLLLPDVQNDFYASIAQALSESCDRQGYRLILSITGDDRDAEHRHLKDLAGARVSGIIIVPTRRPRRESATLLKGIRHVQLLRRTDSLGPAWFGIDDEAALAAAAQHLIGLGHRRIAYIGGDNALSTGSARAAGVRRAFEAAGFPQDDLRFLLGDTTVDAGAVALASLLDDPLPPTAVVSGSVHVTQGMLAVLNERGTKVPRDLSVIGFGDPFWFAWWGPGMTTIRPPVQSLATTCCLWFLDQLRESGEGKEAPGHHAIAQSALVIRGTTAPPKA